MGGFDPRVRRSVEERATTVNYCDGALYASHPDGKIFRRKPCGEWEEVECKLDDLPEAGR